MKRIYKKFKISPQGFRAIILSVLLLAILVEGVVLFRGAHSKRAAGPIDVRKEAGVIVGNCKAKGGSTGTCYENTVPDLLSKYSMKQVFDVVREIRNEDRSYGFCHVLGHKIGEVEVARDPSKWMDTVAMCPSDGLCSNGCGHGAIMARYRADGLRDSYPVEYIDEKIVPDLSRVCEPRTGFSPSPLDKAICYHGLGHVIDFLADGDIKVALDTCRKVSPQGYGRVCLEGVYMQVYQPLEPDDFALVKKVTAPLSSGASTTLTIASSKELCDKFAWSTEEKGACHRESWPLHRDELRTSKGIDAFCAVEADPAEKSKCYETAITINARFAVGDSSYMLKLCKSLSADQRGRCYDIGSRAVVEEDRTAGEKAIAFCTGIDNKKDSSECLEKLAANARFTFGQGTSLQSAFCAQMPESYRNTCLQ